MSIKLGWGANGKYRIEMHTEYWWEDLKERDYLEGLGVNGSSQI